MNAKQLRFLCWVATLLSLLGGVFLAATSVPLGVPGEWTWDRCPSPATDLFRRSLWLLSFALLFVAFSWLGLKKFQWRQLQETANSRGRPKANGQKASDQSKPSTKRWLSGLTVVGFCWLWAVQSWALPPLGLGKAAWVLYYPSASGYFLLAKRHEQDFSTFLSNYAEFVRHGDVLHIGTHPPGLVLLYRAAKVVCQQPLVRTLVAATEPTPYMESSRIIRTLEGAEQFTASDEASVWLVALLTQLVAVSAVFPLFELVRRRSGLQAAWQSVAFWPLVPSLAVFLPKSDALYPTLALWFLYWWDESSLSQQAERPATREVIFRAAASAAVLWLGLLLSLALLPALLLACSFLVVRCFVKDGDGREAKPFGLQRNFWSRVLVKAAGFVGTFGLLCFLFWWACGLNLLEVWKYNYQNHAAFYRFFPRTYWKWLLVNPVESVFAVGVPAAVLAGTGLWLLWRNWNRLNAAHKELVAVPLVLGLLWLSGKNMGEAARLWLVVLPWPLWLSGVVWQEAGETLSKPRPNSEFNSARSASTFETNWLWLLTLQLLFCVVVTGYVDGFNLCGPLFKGH